MHFVLRAGYEGAAQLARALSLVAPAGRNKVLDSFAARRGVLARFRAFRREPSVPLLWMHAPSVGEGLQARPVLELVRAREPRVQLAYTWFSPSAKLFAATLDVDFADALPFDTGHDSRAALAALAPTALVFSKLDVWPTLAREATRRGVRTGLISATLSRESSRTSGLAGAILREAYARLDSVGAISVEDADRLVALGVPASRIRVTGDTRYDQVWARAKQVDRASALLMMLAGGRPTVVAGSTWPSDEAVLLPAWLDVTMAVPAARLIIAPHEPTQAHVASLEQWARGAGLRCARLDEPTAADADVVVVNRVGVLGELYALATAAFVGGAFHAAGLHSVLEPAAFGTPVVFGPRYRASRDARLLVDEDAAVAVDDGRHLAGVLETWLSSDVERRAAGEAAEQVVRRGLGAAERSFTLVRSLLG